MIQHQVFFWLKNPGSETDRQRLVAGLRQLGAIEGLRELRIGYPAATEQRDVVDASFDVSELMLFDSTASQKAYQDHPLHKQFVAQNEELWAKLVVYDSQLV